MKGRSAKPRLRFADGRFAPYGSRRNPNAKGKTTKSYNQQTRSTGTGVADNLRKVRNKTGQKKRSLVYGHILSSETAKQFVKGKVSGIRGIAKARELDRKSRNMSATAYSEFLKQRTGSTIPEQVAAANKAHAKVSRSASKHQIEFDFDTKAGRYKGAGNFAVTGVGLGGVFGVAAIVAKNRQDRENKARK